MTDYNYASFKESGQCFTIMSSAVPLDLPYLVAKGTKPEDIYLDLNQNEIKAREDITLTINRDYFVNDGVDSPIISGLPADGQIAVNNIVGAALVSEQSGAFLIEAVGKYRSQPLSAVFLPLADIAERFIRRVDEAAGIARGKYMTSIPGQQMVYSAKEAEARAHLAGEPGIYPYLTAEAAASGTSITDLAQVVLDRVQTTETALASIEALRIGAKQAISTATDAATILAAADITWP